MSRTRYKNDNMHRYKKVTCVQCGEEVTKRQSLAVLPQGRLILGTALRRRCREHDRHNRSNTSGSN